MKKLIYSILGGLTVLLVFFLVSPKYAAKRSALGTVGSTLIHSKYHQAVILEGGKRAFQAQHNLPVIGRATKYMGTFGSGTKVFREIARIAAEADQEYPRLEAVLDLAVRSTSQADWILALAESVDQIDSPEDEAKWQAAYGAMLEKAEFPSVEAALASANNTEPPYVPANGDIIFHTSKSPQSTAIQLVTHSKYSHMGIVYIRNGKPVVFEAVEPVKTTPLKDWTTRGEGQHFVVKRLANAATALSPETLARMEVIGEGFAGKHYDKTFEWSDDSIYCSELVWKIYQRGLGVEIGALETLGDFDLSSPTVQKIIAERWRGNPPLDEKVISPAAMFGSDLLVEVYSGRAGN